MKHRTKLALVGMGGYGGFYLRELLRIDDAVPIQLAGIVEPRPEKCRLIQEVKNRHIPVFSDLSALYAQTNVDLLVISSPIQFHCEQTCLALTQSSNVLCEKPISATIDDAQKMIAARDAAGKFVAIGFQWCYSPGIQQLKADIAQGRFGRPKRLKCMVFMPRGLNYYQRNNWAGKIRDAQGRWVLDSPVNNAASHYLFNMFYVLGDKPDRCAELKHLQAELYRANDIENFDTAALRLLTKNDTEILFYTSHAAQGETEVQFSYEFENAVVEASGPPYNITARNDKGIIAGYGDPNRDEACKLWQAIDMVRNATPPACGLGTAMRHTSCIQALHFPPCHITDFPRELTHKEPLGNDLWIRMDKLFDTFKQCYDNNVLPGEIPICWSKPAQQIRCT